MSKQITKLMKKYPQVFESVSYEGNGIDKWGCPEGDGTWLYLQPSWYSLRTETSAIHEYTIKDVLEAASDIYQDKAHWIKYHPGDTKEIELVLSGAYDK